MSSFTPSGSGGAVTTAQVVGATNPVITNVLCSVVGTEYSFTVPTNAKQFMVQARTSAILQLAYIVGTSGSIFLTIPARSFYSESDLSLSAPLTLYFQSSNPTVYVELVVWT